LRIKKARLFISKEGLHKHERRKARRNTKRLGWSRRSWKKTVISQYMYTANTSQMVQKYVLWILICKTHAYLYLLTTHNIIFIYLSQHRFV
jgi:hypothetical protein